MSIFRKHKPIPYYNNGMDAAKEQFITASHNFLDTFGTFNNYNPVVEEVLWTNPDILTSYDLRRCVKGQELDQSFVDAIELTITTNYLDRQQSIAVYTIVPFYNGWTVKHVQQTKEQIAESEAQFAAIPQPETGVKVIVNTESNPTLEMEMLIHAVSSGMESYASRY